MNGTSSSTKAVFPVAGDGRVHPVRAAEPVAAARHDDDELLRQLLCRRGEVARAAEKSVQEVEHGIAPLRAAVVVRRKMDLDLQLGRVAEEVLLQRR
jgi:hypothetical protein